MNTRTRWLVGAAVCVVAVIAAATVAQMTEQDEPMLVLVPCDPAQSIGRPPEKCFELLGRKPTKQEGFSLMCNSYSAKNEEHLRDRGVGDRGVDYCGPEIPDIPEDREWAAGIRPLAAGS